MKSIVNDQMNDFTSGLHTSHPVSPAVLKRYTWFFRIYIAAVFLFFLGECNNCVQMWLWYGVQAALVSPAKAWFFLALTLVFWLRMYRYRYA
eukprot:TRINITY_DN6059_c0_g1::TRINITY_DN6059_c0_g1_i1::g.25681::m.25681 TRINITY_DN6059_c0_g1::TRINITY_DN6059_c0_g1_i1::g.25681  ORF type:complete len:107 (-),score=1.72 TRINITY_DN6059_c0_g1_i1:234-509(-)